MPNPQPGDILIRWLLVGAHYDLVDIVTLEHVAGPFVTVAEAVTAARERNPRAVWQQSIDERGRPLGDPFKLPHAT